MSDSQVNDGLVRKRRFLIGVSLALGCFNVLGLEIKQISLLGNSAEVHNTGNVIVLAWIVWGWAFAQYVLWFRDADAWGSFVAAIRSDCEKKLGSRLATEPIPGWLVNQLRESLQGQLGAANAQEIRHVATFARIHGDGKHRERAADVEVTAYARLPEQRGEIISGPVRFEREISANEWRTYVVRAVFKVLITRRFTLEYFAPFAIGLVPIAEWLIRRYC